MPDGASETLTDTAGVARELRAIRRSLAILAIIAVFVVFYFARDLILPILMGFLLALTLSPINRTMQRAGIPAIVSAIGLIAIATTCTVAIAYFAGDTVRTWSGQIPSISQELQYKLGGVKETVDAVQDASAKVEELTNADTPEGPQPVVVERPSLLSLALSTAATTLTAVAVALILAFFLLATGDLFYVKLVQAFPTMREKKRALNTVYSIERSVSRYLLTITAINAGLGVAVAAALWALGLEYAYVWGVAAFLLNYLPFLGGLIGTVLVGVHAIVFFDSVYYALLAPVTYQFLTAFEANFITPYLVGKRLELNVVSVFLTVILWWWLWGIAGALVAVPFLIVFKVICSNFEELDTIRNFLGAAETREKA